MRTLKKLFFAKGLIILMITFFACESKSTGQNSSDAKTETLESSYIKLAPADFRSKLEAEEGDFYLIDVRTQGEFEAGAIANAENFDIMNGDFQKQMENWDPSKPIYVYCAKGGRSTQAAKILESKGFDKIIELKGGYSAWK